MTSVKPLFLDHNDPSVPFFVGWEQVLNKYFSNLPAGFTFSFFFEFSGNKVVIRHLCSTPDEEAFEFTMCSNPELVRKAILKDLFGGKDLKQVSVEDIRLARHQGNKVLPKKLKSLSKKYFSIPSEFLSYYPDVAACDSESDEEENDAEVEESVKSKNKKQSKKKKKNEESTQLTGLKGPGRPKKAKIVDASQPSILKFFKN